MTRKFIVRAILNNATKPLPFTIIADSPESAKKKIMHTRNVKLVCKIEEVTK